MARIFAGLDDEAQGCKQEVDEFGCVGVMDVRLQPGQEVEGEFEFLEDIDEVSGRRRSGSHA